jgi:hypothetical protein
MPRIVLICLCAALFTQGAAHADNITYTILDQPSLQDGFHITGQIVTDGKIGTLSSSDIVSWNYQFTNPSGVVSDHNSTSQFSPPVLRGVTATATTIYVMATGTGPEDIINVFHLQPGIFSTLDWEQRFTVGTPPTSQIVGGEKRGFVGPLITPQLDPLVVAAPTPEPISLVLAIIGGGMLAGAGIARRRVKE